MDEVAGTTETSSTPFFSVCLPTYNRGYVLSNAIRSVLEQDWKDFELLICDNASTDNTRAVAESFDDPRIRFMHWDDLVSMYANHNRCLKYAYADWVVFLHSDDVLMRDALTRFHQIIQCHSPDVVYAPLPHAPRGKMIIRDAPHLDFFFNHGLSPSGTAYKKSAVFANSYFAENDLIADLSQSVAWAAQGRKTVHSKHEFAIRDLGENTTSYQVGCGQWNVIVNQCLSPHLSIRSNRQQIEIDAPNRTPAEVKYAINAMAVCGHPLTIASMCLHLRLFHWYCFKAFLKGALIRTLGVEGFARIVFGKRGLKTSEPQS